jgi:hypothetical protein
VPPFWKVSGHQVIGDPTTLGFCCWSLLLVLIQRTQFNALIVSWKTWSFQLCTPCLKILMMGILFLSCHMILAFFLFVGSAQGDVVKKWGKCIFQNGEGSIYSGFLWTSENIWMNNICIRITRMAIGNVISLI